MAKNSSILILNGHGGYYKNSSCEYGYKYMINFICEPGNKLKVMSNTDLCHNIMIMIVVKSIPHSIKEFLIQLKEKKAEWVQDISSISEEYHLCYADKLMKKETTLTPIKISIKPEKFYEYFIYILNTRDDSNIITLQQEYFRTGMLKCELDKERAELEAFAAKNATLPNYYLSNNCPLYIIPTGPFNQIKSNPTELHEKCNSSTSLLSRLKLLSKLKISFAVSATKAAIVSVFIGEDGVDSHETYFRYGEGKQKWEKANEGLKTSETGYFEFRISIEADIIWDSCRVEIPRELAGNNADCET